MSELMSRFNELERVLNTELVERSEEIRCALLALISGKTFFMVGEPGIAKSMLARRIHAYVEGGRFFDHDMDRFTTPEDLFGPRDLSAMKAGRWERIIDGTILTADWAMLDEFFEASSATLKTLLRALNERDFHNGTAIVPIPLTTVFCASNTVPSEGRLMPLYDRLLIRRQLSHIRDHGAFEAMLRLQRPERPEPILTWADVEEARAEAAKVELDERIVRAVVDIRQSLARKDICPSDRRFYEAMAVVRAAAWRDGCATAEPEHLLCLEDICWHDPAQIPEVAAAIDTVLDPLVSQVTRLMREMRTIDAQIRDGLPEIERKALAAELHESIKRAHKELEAFAEGARSARQRRQIDDARKLRAAVATRIVEVLFQRKVTR